jgi:hypothetical protein
MPYKNRLYSVTPKVDEDTLKIWRAAAGNKSLAEWVRLVVTEHLEQKPLLRALLEEQLAANYIQESLLHALAAGTKPTVDTTRQLIATAHRKKSALADEALGIGGKPRRPV